MTQPRRGLHAGGRRRHCAAGDRHRAPSKRYSIAITERAGQRHHCHGFTAPCTWPLRAGPRRSPPGPRTTTPVVAPALFAPSRQGHEAFRQEAIQTGTVKSALEVKFVVFRCEHIPPAPRPGGADVRVLYHPVIFECRHRRRHAGILRVPQSQCQSPSNQRNRGSPRHRGIDAQPRLATVTPSRITACEPTPRLWRKWRGRLALPQKWHRRTWSAYTKRYAVTLHAVSLV